MASWSDLATDVLEMVTSFLPMADQHRFSAVCHNWRFVAKQKRYLPTPELPWLVLGEDERTKKRNFFNLSEKRHYSMNIPELYGQYICGSSHGWLFTVDIKINGRLLNPFTRECYELPPFPPFDEKFNVSTLTEEPVYDSSGTSQTFTFKEMQSALVMKAILSHDPKNRMDFTAMILFGSPFKIAMWRPHDKYWTVVPTDKIYIVDIISFEDIFYAVGTSGMVYVIEVGSNPTVMKTNIRIPPDPPTEAWQYLINFRGQLLFVMRFQETEGTTIEFDVAMLNMKEETWDYLDNIDDLALFIGKSSAVVVDPDKFPGCIKNGIYFGDMFESYFWQEFGHDFGVYDVVEDTIGQFCPTGNVFHPPDAALTWITPNL